jgi:putative endonuclease
MTMRNMAAGWGEPKPGPCDARRRRGRVAYLAGDAAEKAAATAYDRRGADLIETRWRGRGGEIDLILVQDGVHVFCEVKAARRLDDAIASLRPAQMARIRSAASEYLARTPLGQLSEVRFDLAAVDRSGRVEIIENAFGHF